MKQPESINVFLYRVKKSCSWWTAKPTDSLSFKSNRLNWVTTLINLSYSISHQCDGVTVSTFYNLRKLQKTWIEHFGKMSYAIKVWRYYINRLCLYLTENVVKYNTKLSMFCAFIHFEFHSVTLFHWWLVAISHQEMHRFSCVHPVLKWQKSTTLWWTCSLLNINE